MALKHRAFAAVKTLGKPWRGCLLSLSPMFESLITFFQETHLTLWGPFIVLILCGLGLPIPEDIVLITAGALGQADGRSWIEISALMYAGVIGGDTVTFFAGRHLGGWVLTSNWFQRIFPPQKQAKVVDFFEKYGSMGLFIGRFLPGLRAPIYFTAGSMKVPFVKFLFFDGLAALISVPVFVWLGHWLWENFHNDIEELNKTLKQSHQYAGWAAVVLVAVVVIGFLIWRRKRRIRKAGENAA
jgi:membrane protein DedA with SNARE-associated domain